MKKQITNLEQELKYNKSRMFKRAHYLVRSSCVNLSEALKQVWAESKSYRKEIRQELESLYRQLSDAFCPRIPAKLQNKWLNEQMAKAYRNGHNLNQ